MYEDTPTPGARVKSWGRDAAERALRAFVATFVAVYTLGGAGADSIVDTSLAVKAGAAGLSAVVSLALSALAKWSKAGPGGGDSAGFTV